MELKNIIEEYRNNRTKIAQYYSLILSMLNDRYDEFKDACRHDKKLEILGNVVRTKDELNEYSFDPTLQDTEKKEDQKVKNNKQKQKKDAKKKKIKKSSPLSSSKNEHFSEINEHDNQQEEETTEINNPEIEPIKLPISASNSSEITNQEHTITICDNMHNKKIIIFKTEDDHKPAKIKLETIAYTDWINIWLDSPQEALKNQGYYDINNQIKYAATSAKEKHAIFVHAFSKHVDQFLKDFGKETTTYNKKSKQHDSAVALPVAIIDETTQETIYGICCYIFDSITGICYHRNFVEKTSQELINEYFSTGFYEVMFPVLA